MTAVTTLPFGRPLTRDDLDGVPDDGHRYEQPATGASWRWPASAGTRCST